MVLNKAHGARQYHKAHLPRPTDVFLQYTNKRDYLGKMAKTQVAAKGKGKVLGVAATTLAGGKRGREAVEVAVVVEAAAPAPAPATSRYNFRSETHKIVMQRMRDMAAAMPDVYGADMSSDDEEYGSSSSSSSSSASSKSTEEEVVGAGAGAAAVTSPASASGSESDESSAHSPGSVSELDESNTESESS